MYFEFHSQPEPGTMIDVSKPKNVGCVNVYGFLGIDLHGYIDTS